jgi:hypothetical protein
LLATTEKREKSEMRRVMPEGRRFKKGQSGNPGGRPKVIADIQELARQKTPEAIETLTDIMINGKQEAARVSAARELLDRVWACASDHANRADDYQTRGRHDRR